jgi:transcriptional regulator with XRE-family HTH domain
VQQEEDNLRVAQLIYDARTKAGLTQTQLARLIGTKQPVISQLEDANYRGHSLTMLRRIADALGKRLRIEFVDRPARRSA